MGGFGGAFPGATDSLKNSLFTPGDAYSDAFGRSRGSLPFITFDNASVFNASPQQFDTALTGGGTSTHIPSESAVRLRVGTVSGDRVIRQSFSRPPYQSGRSQLSYLSAVMGAIKANVVQRIGVFDGQNGLFFEQNGTALQVVRRRDSVDTAILQSAWNLDKMDGTGPSRVTVDTSKVQIFVIDYEWLGAGRIRFGFNLNGKNVYCHEIVGANVLSGVSILTPSGPVRYEIENTGISASQTDILQICSAIIAEGASQSLIGLLAAASSYLTETTGRGIGSGVRTPVCSIRLRAGYEKAAFAISAIDALIGSNDRSIVECFISGTLSGGTPVVTPITDAVEMLTGYDVLSGGRSVLATHISNQIRETSEQVLSTRFIGSSIAGVPEIVTVTITPMIGNSTGNYAGLSWREFL